MSALLAVYRTVKALTSAITDFNFKLSMINIMYLVNVKEDSKD